MAAAVLAAVLSVMTGGPLRCPCYLAQMFCCTDRVADSHTDREDQVCLCHSHNGPGHGDPDEPCDRGIGFEIVAVVVSSGDDTIDGPMMSPVVRTREWTDRISNGPRQFDGFDSRSTFDRLLYFHSFRC